MEFSSSDECDHEIPEDVIDRDFTGGKRQHFLHIPYYHNIPDSQAQTIAVLRQVNKCFNSLTARYALLRCLPEDGVRRLSLIGDTGIIEDSLSFTKSAFDLSLFTAPTPPGLWGCKTIYLCDISEVSTLDTSGHTNLKKLFLRLLSNLTELLLPHDSSRLEHVEIRSVPITSLDLSRSGNLKNLYLKRLHNLTGLVLPHDSSFPQCYSQFRSL